MHAFALGGGGAYCCTTSITHCSKCTNNIGSVTIPDWFQEMLKNAIMLPKESLADAAILVSGQPMHVGDQK